MVSQKKSIIFIEEMQNVSQYLEYLDLVICLRYCYKKNKKKFKRAFHTGEARSFANSAVVVNK